MEDVEELRKYFGTEVVYDPNLDTYRIKIKEGSYITVPSWQVNSYSLPVLKEHYDTLVHEKIQHEFYGEDKYNRYNKEDLAKTNTAISKLNDLEDLMEEANIAPEKIAKLTAATTAVTAATTGTTAETSKAESSAGGTIFMGNPAPGAQDPLRARVEAASRTYIRPMDIAVSSYAASEQAASNSPWKLEPTATAKAKIMEAAAKSVTGVGSAQAHTSPGAVTWNIESIDPRLICKAVDVLNRKNKLFISDFSIIDSDGNSITVKYTADIPGTTCTKEITINLLRRIFIRAEHTIDKYAGLKQSLSDRQYVILRIAYVLFRATKVDVIDATEINNSLCKIINVSETYNHPWLNSTLSSF